MNNYRDHLIAILFVAISGCAGTNPNPGERTTDVAWTSSNFEQAFEIAEPRAKAGEPWAQLRLGIFYENGWGVTQDTTKAEYWYIKAARQKSSGNWADGLLLGATGTPGYFNQDSDARIAQFNLAQLYYNSGENLLQAKMLIAEVIEESEGGSIFFCCEFSGGRSFTQIQFSDLQKQIEERLGSK